MEKEKGQQLSQEKEADEPTSSPSAGKKPWQEPKLAFVEPKLTNHGTLEEVTGQAPFFGGFTPK
jgi:hypothetical protein